MRHETSMHHDHRRHQHASSERLIHSIDAVMGEIAALLDERGTGEVQRAREVLAGAYRCATERRRARRSGPAVAAGSSPKHKAAHPGHS